MLDVGKLTVQMYARDRGPGAEWSGAGIGGDKVDAGKQVF